MENKEIWKNIPGYENHYQASNLGRIKSIKKDKNLIRKLSLDGGGYQILSLCINGKCLTKKVHRLVLESFLGSNELHVNHKNSIRIDNRLINLEYCTIAENNKHSIAIGNKDCNGENSGKAILTNEKAIKIRELYAFGGITQLTLSKMYNISRDNVGYVIRRKTWKHI